MEGIKTVFLDLDGTVLHDDVKVSKRLKEVMNTLKEKINFFVSTGRSFYSAYPIIEELGLKDEAITYNGARIVDIKTKSVLSERALSTEKVKKIIKISRETGIHLNLYNSDKWYVENEDEESVLYSSETGIKWYLANFNDFLEKKSTKALFIADRKKLEELKKILEKELTGVDYVFSRDFFLEILDKGVNKGSAVENILKTYNVSKENAMAFGDQWNDFEMLKCVKYGYLMGNAPAELKKEFSGKNITLTNNEDGVAHILEKLI